MRRFFFLAVGILSLLGCATTTAHPEASAQARKSLSPEEEALMRTDREFNAATQARGVDGWVSYFASNGSMVRPKGPITGHDAIRAAMAPSFADPDFSLTWEPEMVRLTLGGRIGYTQGRYRMTHKGPDGKRVESTGAYVSVWQKQSDGSWQVVADVGDPDGTGKPAQPAAASAAPGT